MHMKRLAVAAIVLPLLYLYVVKLHQVYFFILILGVSTIAQMEFYEMYRVHGILRIAGIALGAILLTTLYLSKRLLLEMIVFSFIVIAGLRLIGKRDPSSSLSDIAPVIAALLYIPCSLGVQLFLRENGPGWILFLFGCVWASDSLAFYIGKTMGKRKLYREVSPNKTVAGAFGSFLGGAAAGWLLNFALLHGMSSWKSAVLGGIIGAITIMGDLVESMFKRDAGVKDSGGIIPGHGGVLDKVDGVLFAGPVFYWVSRAMGFIA